MKTIKKETLTERYYKMHFLIRWLITSVVMFLLFLFFLLQVSTNTTSEPFLVLVKVDIALSIFSGLFLTTMMHQVKKSMKVWKQIEELETKIPQIKTNIELVSLRKELMSVNSQHDLHSQEVRRLVGIIDTRLIYEFKYPHNFTL